MFCLKSGETGPGVIAWGAVTHTLPFFRHRIPDDTRNPIYPRLLEDDGGKTGERLKKYDDTANRFFPTCFSPVKCGQIVQLSTVVDNISVSTSPLLTGYYSRSGYSTLY